MKSNTGDKIDKIASVIGAIGLGIAMLIAFVSVIAGMDGRLGIMLIGCAVAIIVGLSCWIGSILMMGFGEMIEDINCIRCDLVKDKRTSE